MAKKYFSIINNGTEDLEVKDAEARSAIEQIGALDDATEQTHGLMSAADKTKLDGIEAGAEVNVQSDWDAVSGDAQILNKPTLGTAAAKGVAEGVNTSTNLVQSNHVKTYVDNATGAINDKIPTQATSENQLADKAFVNSSVATATAEYKGNYNLVSDLELTTAATHSDIATALGTAVTTADDNDYCYVQIPTDTTTPTQIAKVERYKYSSNAWAYEYELNNSGFTADQWAALNSSITSGLVSKLSALPTNSELNTALGGKVNTSDVVTTVETSSKIPTSNAVVTYVNGRSMRPVNINTLTPSSTFLLGDIIGINGILYRANKNTSSLPVTFATEDGDFVTHSVNGYIAFVITSWTVSADWDVFMDASINYTLASKQDALIFDSTPTANSINMVKSGPIKAAIDAMGATKQNTLKFDSTPTASSTNPVTSGGVKSALDLKLNTSLKGSASGLAELDSNGKVPSSQLPSFVDDVINGYYKAADGKFYSSKSGSTYSGEITGEEGKIYIDLDTNKTYRWNGVSAFVVISETLALGETDSTAYRGDRGKTAYDHSQATHARTDANNSDVSWDSTNKKLTKTVNGTTSDVATANTIVGGATDPAAKSTKTKIANAATNEFYNMLFRGNDGETYGVNRYVSLIDIADDAPFINPYNGKLTVPGGVYLGTSSNRAIGQEDTYIVGDNRYTVSQLLLAMANLMDKNIVIQPASS